MTFALCQRMDSHHLSFQDLKETVASEIDRLETELAESRSEIVRLEELVDELKATLERWETGELRS